MFYKIRRRIRLNPRNTAIPKPQQKKSKNLGKKKRSELSSSMDLFNPLWSWEQLIDSKLVPKKRAMNEAKNMCEKSEENSKISMVHSKSCLMVDRENTKLVGHGTVDRSMLDLLNLVKTTKTLKESNAFQMSELDLISDCQDSRDEIQPDGLQMTIDQAMSLVKLQPLEKPENFEMILRPISIELNKSAALFLTQQVGKRLSASEILTLSLRNFWNPNLELQVGTKFFYVDRYVFTYFAQNFDYSGISIQFPTNMVPFDILTMLYNWMLNDRDEFKVDDQYIPIFIAASFLGIEQLLEHYWFTLSLSGELGLWEQSALEGYMKCRELGSGQMMSILATRIRKMFNPMVACEEFLQLDAKELAHLLKQDTICPNSEDEVFFATIRWLEFDWPDRKKDVPLVMSSVRFPHISPWLRRSLENLCENSLIKEVSQVPEVTAWLWESAKYCMAWMESDSSGHRRRPVYSKFIYNKCAERYWAYCLGVPHHHDVKCPRFREVTYETYKLLLCRLQSHCSEYIENLQYIPNKYWNTYQCCSDIDLNVKYMLQCPQPAIYGIELKFN